MTNDPARITEYHARIYYDPAMSRGRAERVRENSGTIPRPASAAGTTNCRTAPAIDVSGRVPERDAGTFVPWLMPTAMA